MSFASFSLLHRHTPPISTLLLLRRRHHQFSSIIIITSSSTSRRPQNPKQNPHTQPNKNLLKAKQTFKKDFSSSSSSSLTPSLSFDHKPSLSPSQSIGLVASSQANFMRVIIPLNDAVSLPPSNPIHVITITNTNTNDVVLEHSSSSNNNDAAPINPITNTNTSTNSNDVVSEHSSSSNNNDAVPINPINTNTNDVVSEHSSSSNNNDAAPINPITTNTSTNTNDVVLEHSSSSSNNYDAVSLPPINPSHLITNTNTNDVVFGHSSSSNNYDAVSLPPINPSTVNTNTSTNTNDVVLGHSSSSNNNDVVLLETSTATATATTNTNTNDVVSEHSSSNDNNDAVLLETSTATTNANDAVVLETSTANNANANGSSASGMEILCVVRALLKKIKRRVMVGDKVLVGSIDWVDRRGMIENVFQRKNEILDPPVANVDRLLVIFSLDQPKLEPFTLTRFLVEAESTGIPITLALNKMELVDEETVSSWKARLRSWGYEPIVCSVESGHGLDLLAFKLRDQTTVIVGPSGVGKSSLINALRSNPRVSDTTEGENWFEPILGSKWSENQRVGKVSTRSGRGKHTTRHVSLLPLSGGGYLADTPGFNQPSLLKVTKQSLAQTFPEIRKMLSANEPMKCSFNNCLHLGEPGCVVKGDWERYSFYFQLLDEIRIREEFQLRTFGTKREGDVRIKMGDMGVQQAEPRLEPKKHRRLSRKRINQSILDELDDDDDDDSLLDEEDNPVIRAFRNENS